MFKFVCLALREKKITLTDPTTNLQPIKTQSTFISTERNEGIQLLLLRITEFLCMKNTTMSLFLVL